MLTNKYNNMEIKDFSWNKKGIDELSDLTTI